VNIGEGYVYDYITRDESGALHLYSQDCCVGEDGRITADKGPADHTGSIDAETLAEWATQFTLDSEHGDPEDCITDWGHTLVGHRLTRNPEIDK
jgi:hypothetical protein